MRSPAALALAALAAAPACAPDEDPVGAAPLASVIETAASPRGLVVGGVAQDPELFWDAWLVPSDNGPPVRLAPIGDTLVSVDASGALWASISGFDASGTPAYDVRLSPSDGSPAVPLSRALPPCFKPERAVTDAGGRWLLAGTEDAGGTTYATVLAVDVRGGVTRLARDPVPEPPLFLSATLAGDALVLELQYGPDTAPVTVTVPRATSP